MAKPFMPKLDETILYHSLPTHKWYEFVWRVGLNVLEVSAFMLFSFTAFLYLSNSLLNTFLPSGPADLISRILFEILAPLLVAVWFAEDLLRIFTGELVLTNQRIWTKGFPYAWNQGREFPLEDIKSLAARRDGLFVRLKSTKRTQVVFVPDGKEIVKAYKDFMGENETH